MNNKESECRKGERQLRQDYELQKDQLLRKLCLDAQERNPGFVAAWAEPILNTCRNSPDYYRLSTKQKASLIEIAEKQLRIELPAELLE